MRVLRGRPADPGSDRGRTAELLAAAADGTPALRVWTPPRQVAFGRRDVREPGFDRAKRLATDLGFRSVERDVGGRAVAYFGDTLAFAHAIPLADDDTCGRRDCSVNTSREHVGDASGDRSVDVFSDRNADAASDRGSIADRYELATETVLDALRGLGGDVVAGEPSNSFCPGNHSVRVDGGGKVSGIAQRVRSDAALVAGCLVVTRREARAVAEVTESIYGALDVPFDPTTVGSVEDAGGPSDPKSVARAVEDAFVDGPWGDGSRRVERIGEDE